MIFFHNQLAFLLCTVLIIVITSWFPRDLQRLRQEEKDETSKRTVFPAKVSAVVERGLAHVRNELVFPTKDCESTGRVLVLKMVKHPFSTLAVYRLL